MSTPSCCQRHTFNPEKTGVTPCGPLEDADLQRMLKRIESAIESHGGCGDDGEHTMLAIIPELLQLRAAARCATPAVLYVVKGSTGEHDETVEWDVRACTDAAAAGKLVERLTAWCDARGLGETHTTTEWDRTELPDEDPGFRFRWSSSTGTRYRLVEVPFEGTITAASTAPAREGFRGVVWPRQPHPSLPNVYRYVVVGMLVTDRELDVHPNETALDGEVSGLGAAIETVRRVELTHRVGDANNVLLALDTAWPAS